MRWRKKKNQQNQVADWWCQVFLVGVPFLNEDQHYMAAFHVRPACLVTRPLEWAGFGSHNEQVKCSSSQQLRVEALSERHGAYEARSKL